jgi:hypothetical protein
MRRTDQKRETVSIAGDEKGAMSIARRRKRVAAVLLVNKMANIGVAGFEPATPSSRARWAELRSGSTTVGLEA